MKSVNFLKYLIKIALAFSFIAATTGLRFTNIVNRDSANTKIILKDILYFGWFTDATTSESLKEITDLYFNSIIEQFENAKAFMEYISKEHNVTDIQKYFTKPLDPSSGEYDPLYHITAMFCGDKDCSDYLSESESSLGKVFKTELVGVFFTERTFGIRIALSEEQESLFDTEKFHHGHGSDSEIRRKINSSYPGITFEEQELNFQPTTSRAHITLACGPGVPAVETGFDLLKIIQYEADVSGEIIHEDLELSDALGHVRNYMKLNTTTNQNDTLAFVLYPTYRMILNTTFDAYLMESKSNNLRPYYVIIIFLSVCLYWKLK